MCDSHQNSPYKRALVWATFLVNYRINTNGRISFPASLLTTSRNAVGTSQIRGYDLRDFKVSLQERPPSGVEGPRRLQVSPGKNFLIFRRSAGRFRNINALQHIREFYALLRELEDHLAKVNVSHRKVQAYFAELHNTTLPTPENQTARGGSDGIRLMLQNAVLCLTVGLEFSQPSYFLCSRRTERVNAFYRPVSSAFTKSTKV